MGIDKVSFNKTDMGFVPTDWGFKKVEEIAFVEYGISESVSGNTDPSIGIPILTGAKITLDGEIETTDMVYIDKRDSERFELKKGDLLFNWRSGSQKHIGKTALFDLDGEYTFASFILRIRLTEGNSPVYYHQLLNYLRDIGYFTSDTSSQVNFKLNASSFRNLQLVNPPLDEQERIGEILSIWDQAIRLKEGLIAKKHQQKIGLMQNLLTGKIRWNDGAKCTRDEISQRLKTIRQGGVPTGYQKTKVGIIPEDWRVFKAKDLFTNVSDKDHSGNLEVLSSTQDRGVIPRTQLDIAIKYDQRSLTNYKRVHKGDFIISLRSFQGGIEYSLYDGIVSPAYVVLRGKVDIHHGFYRALFKSRSFITRLQSVIYGIRDGKQIGFRDFGELPLQFAPIDEQREIASVLSVCNREIELLEQELNTVKEQKRGIRQLLLTGKVRV